MSAENNWIMIDARAYYVEPPKGFTIPPIERGVFSSIFDRSKFCGQRLQPDLDFDYLFTQGIDGFFDGLKYYSEQNLNDSGIGLDDSDEGIEDSCHSRMVATDEHQDPLVRVKEKEDMPLPIGHGRCKCCQYQRSLKCNQ